MARQKNTESPVLTPVAEVVPEPAAPLSELDVLRDRIKKLEQAEEQRVIRQKKMQSCLTRIDRAEKALASATADLEQAKGAAKSAEGELSHSLNELKLTAKGLPIQMDLPLKVETSITHQAAAAINEPWRQAKLCLFTQVKIKPKTLKMLEENHPSIVTVGDLADWQEKKGDFWAKDIAGIGPSAEENIVAAMDAFWAENPRAVVTPGVNKEVFWVGDRVTVIKSTKGDNGSPHDELKDRHGAVTKVFPNKGSLQSYYVQIDGGEEVTLFHDELARESASV